MPSLASSSPFPPEPRVLSPADELWAHLAGMFGADAIERKFGEVRPPQWDAALQCLKPFELQRGLRRLLASGAKFPPTLPEFMRLARAVETDEDDRRAPIVPRIGGPKPERWAVAVTSRVGTRVCQHFARYSHPADLPGQLSVEALRSPDYRPHPVSVELREPLREAGRRWAAEMRSQTQALGREPNAADQQEVWAVLLIEAEREVDAIRARHQLQSVGIAAPQPSRRSGRVGPLPADLTTAEI